MKDDVKGAQDIFNEWEPERYEFADLSLLRGGEKRSDCMPRNMVCNGSTLALWPLHITQSSLTTWGKVTSIVSVPEGRRGECHNILCGDATQGSPLRGSIPGSGQAADQLHPGGFSLSPKAQYPLWCPDEAG
ncbi:hypothetical protein HID58_053578 [Brassica napus]|uniref:Uncharacterized protein n=1 Tax=Brassica napus TaxID=3708 RepID=A0ABQ8AF45_BRANA|nr:hypothetical protein HID58_053578 [Brassica napus]